MGHSLRSSAKTMKKLYGLIDCNNFFASCERVFQPALRGKPIVVLSSNDGCIVARSNEAKALGIPMGAPYFKFKALLDRHSVQVFSSNFHLYGDMSARVMYTLEQCAHNVQIYSVDEAFIDMTGVRDPIALAKEISARILQDTGIPVSVGIATTKTLAKAANELAKQHPEESGGVWSFAGTTGAPAALSQLEVGDVWGIGRQLATKYRAKGITSAAAVAQCSAAHILAAHGRPAMETVLELRGQDCHVHRKPKEGRKSLIRSQSFGKPVFAESDIAEAVAHHVQKGAAMLRKEGLFAGYMQVYYRTSIFRQDSPYKAVGDYVFTEPTNDTFSMLQHARSIVENTFLPGKRYTKAGVLFADLTQQPQSSLFHQAAPPNAVLPVIDHLRDKLGPRSIVFGSEGLRMNWKAEKGKSSGNYTRSWGMLKKVR